MIFCALLLLAGCTSEEPKELGCVQRIPLEFFVNTLDITRATGDQQGTQFDNGTEVRMNMKIGTAAAQDYFFKYRSSDKKLVPLTASGGSETKLYYPYGNSGSDATNITINYAYAPSTLTAGAAATVASNQSETANYKQSDLVWIGSQVLIRPTSDLGSGVSLTFKHLMTKLRIKVTKGSGVSSITSIKLKGIKNSYTFTPSAAEASVASSLSGSQDIIVASSASDLAGSNYYTASIPAQTISNTSLFLEIATNAGNASYILDKEKSLVAGKQYTLDITVNSLAVGHVATITDWTDDIGKIQVQTALTLLNVTSDHVGWFITSDGYVYQNKAAVDAASKTAVAMIGYVGATGSVDNSGSYRGLALALSDANNGTAVNWCSQESAACLKNTQESNTPEGVAAAKLYLGGIKNTMALIGHTSHTHNAALVAVSNNGTAAPKGTSGWFLPTYGQWSLIVQGLNGGSGLTGTRQEIYITTAVNAHFTNAGFSSATMVNGNYWANNDIYDSQYNYNVAYCYRIYDGRMGNNHKYSTSMPVRSVIAF